MVVALLFSVVKILSDSTNKAKAAKEMKRSSLADPSLVERVYEYLETHRGDLARPVALVISPVEQLETCDAVQQVLDGKVQNSLILSNYVTIDVSSGAIDRWQFVVFSPTTKCISPTACPPELPFCSSLGVCSRLFEGTRDGLKNALAFTSGTTTASSATTAFSGALVETSRDPLKNAPYRCNDIEATTRTFFADLRSENLTNTGGNAAERNVGADTKTDADCPNCSKVSLDFLEQYIVREKERQATRKKNITLIGIALLFFILALIAGLIAAKHTSSKRLKKAEKKQRKEEQRKLDALYADMVSRSKKGK